MKLQRTDDPDHYVAHKRRRRFEVARAARPGTEGNDTAATLAQQGYQTGWMVRELLGKDKDGQQIYAPIADGIKTLREVRAILEMV